MEILASTLPYVQIVLAVLIIVLVLVQQRGAGAGSAFGGDSGFGYNTRRGAEKWIFYACIVVSIIFVLSTILSLVLNQ